MTQVAAGLNSGVVVPRQARLGPTVAAVVPEPARDVSVPHPVLPPSRSMRWALPGGDVAAGVAGVLTALVLGPATDAATALALALVVGWPLVLAVGGRYVRRPIEVPLVLQLRQVARGGAFVGLAAWVAQPLAAEALDPAHLVPVVAVLAGGSVLVTLAALPRRRTRVLLVGDGHEVGRAARELTRSSRCELVGACTTDRELSLSQGVPVRHDVADALDLASEVHAEALVVLPGRDLTPEVARGLQWQSAVPVYVGTGLLDVDPSRACVVQEGGLGLVHVRRPVLSGPRRVLKDVFDRTVAAGALVALLPVLLVVSVLIRWDSPGSAIFRQTRVGAGGRTFTMYKFRTMRTSAELEVDGLRDQQIGDGVLFKLRTDPRITRVGEFLRRYSVDEVPQLWNVVLGHMSLVGPRPALPSEVEQYDADPRRRLVVKPGLTGLWQVSGRSDLSWSESVRLDLRYVDNWSWAHDLDILRRTVRAVLGHDGAY